MQATPSLVKRNFPTLRLIVAPLRWLFGTRRRVLTLAASLLTLIALPTLWWATRLIGLPDVGDPFDLKKFQAETIPDDRNAFVFYRPAATAYQPLDRGENMVTVRVSPQAQWRTSTPQVQRWVEANRAALNLLRQGSERPDALDPAVQARNHYMGSDKLGLLHRVLLLEASRFEDQGEMAEAWSWYRVSLRLIHHFGMHAGIYRRQLALNWHGQFNTRLVYWAADSRTTPDQIRAAIADVVAAGALVASDEFTLKVEYQNLQDGREAWDLIGQSPPPAWYRFINSRDVPLTPDQIQQIIAADRAWHHEPERSKRLTRLLLANRLAYLNLPSERRPAADPAVLGMKLYKFGPEAPAAARALTPAQLEGWLDTSGHASALIRNWNRPWLTGREQTNQRSLLIVLGSELYRREHGGAEPRTDEALVGPYLPSLPAVEPN